jgi:ribonuclease HI
VRAPEPLPSETLSPLAELVDRALAHHGYDLAAATVAVDAAVPGFGGLFDPNTSADELRTAAEAVLAAPAEVPEPPACRGERVVLYVDGSSRGNPGAAGAGAVLVDGALTLPGEVAIDPDFETLAELGRPVGSNTGNNVAEYCALHLGLDGLARHYRGVPVEVRTDSMTVVRSVWDDEPAHPGCDGYADAIGDLLADIPAHEWTHLADHDPNPADALATVGADVAALGP